jgi:predicted ester cyclase
LAAVAEFMATDYVAHHVPSGLPPGADGLKQLIAAYRTAFPDLKSNLNDIFGKGDRVAFRWSVSGTHLGDWFGVSPTGDHVATTGITIFRIDGGKVVEGWTSIDLNPSEEELQRLIEGSGGTTRGDIALAERGISPQIWDALTRNLTWRFRVAEAQERERIEQELRVARSIQQASLPKEVPSLEGWQITPYYQPAREVGGDFYDFFELEDGRVGVVVGDATGKGVPAALVVTATYSMLRAVAQALGSFSPGEVLAQVNETLLARIPSNMFVTCFYAILDPKSASLSYANAGHDLPYLRRRGGDAEELRARGMPLGLMSRMSYEEGEASLREEDSVLFYSDGLVEAHDPKGEMFGFPRLRALVAEDSEEERPLVDFLMEELYSFVGEGWEQEDDITLLTLKRSSPRR